MIGNTVSHYHIIEEIGRGGMGIVYKAQDLKLDRFVALKFLPSHLTKDEIDLSRFIQEAKAAAALNHPNVCTIHEIHDESENPFIVMEYVNGKTLREIIHSGEITSPLQDNTNNYAIQIAEALKAAHDKGIIHRDIKSENIMITETGQVKVMDFGLAKLAGQEQLTQDSSTLGTVAYMSPEQLTGKEVDHRTDIWSLGVVLYEMLTCELPFKGDYEQAIIYSIINEDPKPAVNSGKDISTELGILLKKALTKDTSLRYQNLNNLIIDLDKVKRNSTSLRIPFQEKKSLFDKKFITIVTIVFMMTTAGYFVFKGRNDQQSAPETTKIEQATKSKWKNSIAVLPFADMSPQKDQEYFCDGIAEEILNKLTHVEGLKVIARTSSFQFKGKEEDIPEIGQKLDVSTVLEGSVRKAGKTLRVTALLINVKDRSHIWSMTFDREMQDILAIQDEIALAIIRHLRGELLDKEEKTINKRYTENVKAHQDYLKGRFRLNKLTIQDMKKSVDYFKQAIEQDPLFAPAYCGLAHAYDNLTYSGEMSEIERWQLVEAEAQKAMQIDSTFSEAYMILADAQFLFHWNWEEAEHIFKEAINLNPGNSIARNWYAQYLSAMGRHDVAMKEIEIAQELDPLSLAINLKLYMIYNHARQYDQAERILIECTNLFPDHPWILLTSGYHHMLKKNYREAINQISKINESSIGPVQQFALARALAFAGKTKDAILILKNLQEESNYRHLSAARIAKVYLALGDMDQTYHWLNNAFESRDSDLVYLAVESTYDSIKDDQRYKELVKKMRFPE